MSKQFNLCAGCSVAEPNEPEPEMFETNSLVEALEWMEKHSKIDVTLFENGDPILYTNPNGDVYQMLGGKPVPIVSFC